MTRRPRPATVTLTHTRGKTVLGVHELENPRQAARAISLWLVRNLRYGVTDATHKARRIESEGRVQAGGDLWVLTSNANV